MKISDIIREDDENLQRPTMKDVQQWWIRNVIQVPHVKEMSKDITHQQVYNQITKNWNEYKNLDSVSTVISMAFQSVINDYSKKSRKSTGMDQQRDTVDRGAKKQDEPEYRKDIAGRTLRDPRYYRDRETPSVRDRAAAAKTRAGRAYNFGRDLPSKIARSGPARFVKGMRDLTKKLK